MARKNGFQLEAPNGQHLLTLQQAADSCGITRQAFHGWAVKPERVAGTAKLYSLAAILENRLQAARTARSPDETDRERIEARLELLRAQIERERVLASKAADRYAPAAMALEIIEAAFQHARTIINALPDALLDENPELAEVSDLIRAEVDKAVEALQTGPPGDWIPTTATMD